MGGKFGKEARDLRNQEEEKSEDDMNEQAKALQFYEEVNDLKKGMVKKNTNRTQDVMG